MFILKKESFLDSIKLGKIHLWVKRITNCSNKGPDPHQRGDNHNNGVRSFKNLFDNQTQIYLEAS
jgi:hypothetical protein